MKERVLSKVRRRLIPFLLLLYVAAYLDRINVGFAALEMKADLGFSDTVYGLGAGLFFIGYFLFEVPSNLLLERMGARVWLARIMITWGVISTSMLFVKSVAGFYALRFLLGAAEAGFFPGVLLYLTYWFPAKERAGAIARFVTAAMIAWVVGGPLSGALMKLDGLQGLRGWQWLFLLEGLPSVILGLVTLRFLPERPMKARWLSLEERMWLEEEIRGERVEQRKVSAFRVLGEGRFWLICAAYFLLTIGSYGFSLWLPQIVKEAAGGSAWVVGLLTAIPYGLTALGMVWIAGRSDRSGERRLHVAVPLFAAAVGLAGAALSKSPLPLIACLCAAAIGNFGCLGPFWALATRYLGPTAAAGGIALINSIGNLGGFVGPYAVGWVRERTSGFTGGFLLLSAALVAAALLVLLIRETPRPAPRDVEDPLPERASAVVEA
ncbi:MAG TPA: MFS transporter [Planctomycetota bacterium]